MRLRWQPMSPAFFVSSVSSSGRRVLMGLIKGQADFKKWKRGQALTRKESIDAQCFSCNGGENVCCNGETSCPLYRYSPFSREAIRNRAEDAGNGRLPQNLSHKNHQVRA